MTNSSISNSAEDQALSEPRSHHDNPRRLADLEAQIKDLASRLDAQEKSTWWSRNGANTIAFLAFLAACASAFYTSRQTAEEEQHNNTDLARALNAEITQIVDQYAQETTKYRDSKAKLEHDHASRLQIADLTNPHVDNVQMLSSRAADVLRLLNRLVDANKVENPVSPDTFRQLAMIGSELGDLSLELTYRQAALKASANSSSEVQATVNEDLGLYYYNVPAHDTKTGDPYFLKAINVMQSVNSPRSHSVQGDIYWAWANAEHTLGIDMPAQTNITKAEEQYNLVTDSNHGRGLDLVSSLRKQISKDSSK